MARKKWFEVSAVNIVIHPHNPGKYVDLLKAWRRLKHPPRIRGEYHAYLGSLRSLNPENSTKGMEGDFFKFFELDKKDAWLNVVEEKRAEAGDTDQIKLPEDLKPHLGIFRFVFFPETHELFYISEYREDGRLKTLGPSQVVKMLEKLSERPSIVNQFGKVDITAIPDHETLKEILELPKLRRLYIELNRPNPDELDADLERRVLERLKQQQASKLVEELTAEEGASLKPDAETIETATVAQFNGAVIGYGRDSKNRKVFVSTENHPLKETVKYPSGELERDHLRAKARELQEKLRAARAANRRKSVG